MRQGRAGWSLGLVGAVALLAMAGTGRRSGAAPGAAPITLEIPAGVELKVVAPSVSYDQATQESTFSGPTTLTWPNGARLVVPGGGATVLRKAPNRGQLIRIEYPTAGSR